MSTKLIHFNKEKRFSSIDKQASLANVIIMVGNLLKFFEILFKFEDKILGPKSEESKPLLK